MIDPSIDPSVHPFTDGAGAGVFFFHSISQNGAEEVPTVPVGEYIGATTAAKAAAAEAAAWQTEVGEGAKKEGNIKFRSEMNIMEEVFTEYVLQSLSAAVISN